MATARQTLTMAIELTGAAKIESLLGFLGVSWRMAAERAALHGKQDGNG